MLVEENGKRYNVDDDTGIVTEASAADTEEAVDFSDEFRIGERVEVEGELGELVSLTASVYGPAFGVRFDNGSVDEFPEGALKRSTVEKIDFETPIAEVEAAYAAYELLPVYTNDELDAKEREARRINLRAKSLVTDSKLAFTDQTELGRIALATGTDLLQIKELREQSEETQEYIGRFNRYKIAETIDGYGGPLGAKGDASWLDGAIDDLEVAETTDADLAARATEVVAVFSKAQLEDDGFMSLASSYQRAYLQMDDDRAAKFEALLSRARQSRLRDFPAETKVASAEDDLTDFDASAIFL